ncbi:hypothetical protein VIGAN_05131300 [Vigna angularis var. angularis]|uniref:Subtilisin-like protease fibronectin type-III domain-containing protein n=1 Tax=Vigna angularis var. angularis TaxID=157739 RepID=A0A0S3S4X5_PHAAN|nr:hypothetical protein VIGAN_05131300 [Vigna angularis var. angularis]
MDKSYMPKVFTSQRHWYSSTVTSLDSATQNVNRSILYSYENALHGFSVALSPKQLESLKETPGFISAYRDRAAILDTTASYAFLSLNVSHGLWPASNYGQNVVVGVVDSGIWPESDSFKDDGMATQTPPKWKGKCEGGQRFDPSLCNSKLVGASPLDNSGKPIEENGELSPRASPLAMGAGLIDPNRALDPGLVYDATPQDYVNLLCAMNFTQAQILTITRSKAYNCSSPSYDVNYPSFVAFSVDLSVTVKRKFRRIVTYVGDGPAAYTARVSSSNGTQISVSPNRLVFKAKYEKRKFSLTLKSEMKKENAMAFGSLEWVEETGRHVVRSPLVVVPTNFVFNP